MKLFDSEWKVMEVLWQENDRTAKEISLRLADSIGWNKNTTYTVIKKCIDKGAIERWEPKTENGRAHGKGQYRQQGFDHTAEAAGKGRRGQTCPGSHAWSCCPWSDWNENHKDF